jgi:hypothetical protein
MSIWAGPRIMVLKSVILIGLILAFPARSLAEEHAGEPLDAPNSERATGDSQNIALIGRWANGPCYAVDVVGDIAYFGNGAYLEIVDWSEPGSPVQLGRELLPGPVWAVDVEGAFAYAAVQNDGLFIIDVSIPSAPLIISTFPSAFGLTDVAVRSGIAYLAGDNLIILDVSNPAAPIEMSRSGTAYRIALSGNYAYTTARDEWLTVIDISDPNAPEVVGFAIAGPGELQGVAMHSLPGWTESRSSMCPFQHRLIKYVSLIREAAALHTMFSCATAWRM